jgi:hypothetical protein
VADIGDVHHVRHVKTQKSQRARQQILEQKRAQVADVGEVVHGRPAGIQTDLAGRDRLKAFLGAGQRVVQKKLGHGHVEKRAKRSGSRVGALLAAALFGCYTPAVATGPVMLSALSRVTAAR